MLMFVFVVIVVVIVVAVLLLAALLGGSWRFFEALARVCQFGNWLRAVLGLMWKVEFEPYLSGRDRCENSGVPFFVLVESENTDARKLGRVV